MELKYMLGCICQMAMFVWILSLSSGYKCTKLILPAFGVIAEYIFLLEHLICCQAVGCWVISSSTVSLPRAMPLIIYFWQWLWTRRILNTLPLTVPWCLCPAPLEIVLNLFFSCQLQVGLQFQMGCTVWTPVLPSGRSTASHSWSLMRELERDLSTWKCSDHQESECVLLDSLEVLSLLAS